MICTVNCQFWRIQEDQELKDMAKDLRERVLRGRGAKSLTSVMTR